jgi:uncharacterized membrane protein
MFWIVNYFCTVIYIIFLSLSDYRNNCNYLTIEWVRSRLDRYETHN